MSVMDFIGVIGYTIACVDIGIRIGFLIYELRRNKKQK